LFLVGCSGSNTNSGDHAHAPGKTLEVKHTYGGGGPIKVVCTTGMVADLARTIGGSHVDVHALMGEGVDPHQFKVGVEETRRLDGADLILYNGLHLEGKMGDLFGRMSETKPTFGVCEYLPAFVVLQFDGAYDPHVWFDVSLWAGVAGVIGEILARYDPPHAAEYRDRQAKYQTQLMELHERVKKDITQIPKERRVLVTAHDAFHYFGRAYDIEVRAIQGVSTESDAGVREINELVEFVTSRKIKAVFVEDSVPRKNVESLIAGCKSKGHPVAEGGTLYSDSMGKDGTAEGTYPGMVEKNVKTILDALK